MDEERRLYFQCPCGYWSHDLTDFLPHATRCHQERARARERARMAPIWRHRIDRPWTPSPWRINHYLSRMLGILPHAP